MTSCYTYRHKSRRIASFCLNGKIGPIRRLETGSKSREWTRMNANFQTRRVAGSESSTAPESESPPLINEFDTEPKSCRSDADGEPLCEFYG